MRPGRPAARDAIRGIGNDVAAARCREPIAPDVSDVARDMMVALVAAGQARTEALGAVAAAMGDDGWHAVRPLWLDLVRDARCHVDARFLCLEAFGAETDAARRAYADWLAGPGGRAGGYLDLSGVGRVSLPDGLTVRSHCWLDDCPGIVLPEGMTVMGSLYLRGSGKVRIPESLVMEDGFGSGTQMVHTDAHPDGISLDGWRLAHPEGSE